MQKFIHKSETTRPWTPALAVASALASTLILCLACGHDEVSRTPVATTPAPVPGAAPGGAPAGAPPAVPPLANAHSSMPPGAMPPMGANPHAALPPGTMPPGAMPMGAMPAPPRPTGSGALKWTTPKGWTENPGSGMRYATLLPPGGGKAEMSVVVLPGPAGGELANVNRWRGQIGLPPLEESALGAARKTVQSKAGTVAVYDFTGAGDVKSRMVTGLLATPDGNTWFLKLVGEAEPVGKAKPAFMKFLESLRLG